jgi:hypothetical protein
MFQQRLTDESAAPGASRPNAVAQQAPLGAYSAASIQHMQSLAGNRAVTQLLGAQRSPLSVQRQDEAGWTVRDPRDAGAMDPSGAPAPTAVEPFFHGSTWRIAQSIPGNVQPIGGGDFGQGFYTHHDADTSRALERAKLEGCRLCRKMSPPERYAGVIRFDVPLTEYQRLFDNRRDFRLTSTTQDDYAARQQEWMDFVSGPGRGREASPSYDPAHASWRHQRVTPAPDQGYDLIEGPMYRGVEGLPGPDVPPRSQFRPYEEGTALPQQVVWNHQRAMDVLNAAPTTLMQFDATNDCQPVNPPVNVPPLNASIMEDQQAADGAQAEMTGR